MITRRQLLLGGLGGAGLALAPEMFAGARRAPDRFILRTGKSEQQIAPQQYGLTRVWCFNERLPGPEIRLRQGERARIRVENHLDQDTTVHWHGLRLDNAMDGVPHLTQPPIPPGGDFAYEFDAVDAGTFWYHPHHRSFEQVGRGLYGAFIVEEPDPPRVDRELTWVLDDWLLERSARISETFGDGRDMSHAGRIGNTVTVNGVIPHELAVRGGERIRLRLINAANARIFALEFESHEPRVIALDGHPVEPHSAPGGQLVVAPGARVDAILDCSGGPGERFAVTDRFYADQAYALLDMAYQEQSLRENPPDDPVALAPNPLPEPEVNHAIRHEIHLAGGARGSMRGAMLNGQWRDLRELVHNGKAWAINGVAAHGHVMDPLLTLPMGRTCILDMFNDTAWHHPMHLHGHAFRVLSRDGAPTRHREWRDTVLMDPGERVEIAFVADNPGDWMFHCHVLEHQAGGMTGVVRVA